MELDELWFTSEVLMKSLEKYSSGSEKLYEKNSRRFIHKHCITGD